MQPHQNNDQPLSLRQPAAQPLPNLGGKAPILHEKSCVRLCSARIHLIQSAFAPVSATIQIIITMRKARLLANLSVIAGLLVGAAASAQNGYVVNSDDVSARDFDSLHRVVLQSGQAVKVGELRPGRNDAPYADVEGLAFNSKGVLYGIDDATKTLIRIEPSSGAALPVGGREGNTGLARTASFDFGLTFDCNGGLYASSDSRRSLYQLDSDTGVATLVGTEGGLGAPITGLAAKGNTVYGIGSEGFENLYRIDVTTGRATLVGPLGANLRFSDGGLDFDANGVLWGVADMSGASLNPEPSILFRINEMTGAAERVATTVSGVESLAIVPPICANLEGTPQIPAIPTLSGQSLSALALMMALLGVIALPLRSR